MFALKQYPFVVFLLFLVVSCGSEAPNDPKSDTTEKLPKVDASKFREVSRNGIRIPILKEMSLNRVSGDILFSADYLPEEYHIEVSRIPISRFRKDKEYEANKGTPLKWFAEKESQQLQNHLSKLKKESMQELKSNKKECFKQTLYGKEFGFPMKKVYFLRFYQEEDAFVSIVCWTTEQNAKEFEKYAQYMGMMLR